MSWKFTFLASPKETYLAVRSPDEALSTFISPEGLLSGPANTNDLVETFRHFTPCTIAQSDDYQPMAKRLREANKEYAQKLIAGYKNAEFNFFPHAKTLQSAYCIDKLLSYISKAKPEDLTIEQLMDAKKYATTYFAVKESVPGTFGQVESISSYIVRMPRLIDETSFEDLLTYSTNRQKSPPRSFSIIALPESKKYHKRLVHIF